MNESIKLSAFRVSQQIGDLFVAKIKAEEIVQISYSDVRELTEQRDVETYLGIQRPLNKVRTKEIKEYVKNIDATFPTSIILSIDEEYIDWDEQSSTLEIYLNKGEISPAKILDGQHRVAGFMDIETGKPLLDLCRFERDGRMLDFELIITLFVGLDLSEQATIFSTVNLKQTKVSRSLVYDLESYAHARSPQKTAHDVVVTLDNHKKSPFFGRIKRLGRKDGEFETITQAAMVEEIIKLISHDAMADRDILLRKEKKSFSISRNELVRTDYNDGKVFRNLFIDDKDEVVLKTILSFFVAVEARWPDAWEVSNTKSVLNKTVGVKALFRVLRDICTKKWSTAEEATLDREFFRNILENMEVDDTFFQSLEARSASISAIYTKLRSYV